MKALRFAVLGAAALFVAACLPVTTKNPVGSTAGFRPDAALAGVWLAHGENKDDKPGYIAFLGHGDNGMTALLISPDGKDGEWESYTLETAMLGGNRYMNVRSALKNGEPDTDMGSADRIPMLYRLAKDGTITLYILDDDKTAAAIKAGKIAGKIDPGSSGDVHITAAPKALDAFFATKGGAALFDKPFVALRRVK